MTTLLVVPARMGSRRLPGKVLKPLAGAPLLQRLLERLRSARHAFELAVATTGEPADEAVAALCARLGVRCFRGHSSDLLERHYQLALAEAADLVVRVPADCPLIDPAILDRALDLYETGAYDFVSNLHPATYPDGNDVEVFPFWALETAWRHARGPAERAEVTAFLWRHPESFRIGNLEWEIGLDLSASHRFRVGSPADYQFASTAYQALWSPERPFFGLDDVLDLAEREEIFAINAPRAAVAGDSRARGSGRARGMRRASAFH